MGLAHILKVLLVSPVVLAIVIVHGTIELSRTILWGWLNNGKEFWDVKPRKTPPKCLTDKVYGAHHFANDNGITLHYVECGHRSKPLMLFVHGFPESWFSWRHQIKHFSNSYWVVAIDLRGYGESDKPKGISNYTLDLLADDINEFVTKGMGRESCILVGHDWGAAICYKVAEDHANLVDNLIIMNGAHATCMQQHLNNSLTQMWKSWYMIFFWLPVFPEYYYYNEDLQFFKRMFTDSENNSFATEEEIEAFKYTFSTKEAWTPPINFYRAIGLPFGIFRKLQLKKITSPTLTLWGDADTTLNKQLAEMTRECIKDLTLIYIPGGNHYIQQHKPIEVNYLMESYLRGDEIFEKNCNSLLH